MGDQRKVFRRSLDQGTDHQKVVQDTKSGMQRKQYKALVTSKHDSRFVTKFIVYRFS